MTLGRRIGLAIVFGWFFFGGIGHFIVADFFIGIVPPWPFAEPWPLTAWSWPEFAVYVSGVIEIALALAVLHAPVRHYAGYALIALTLAVTPANVYMWLNPELFAQPPYATPYWVLTLRLFIQVALLWCIWWSTRPPGPSRSTGAAEAA
ncbi:MAG: hypothetical protein ACOY33_01235 [Pseudomonadota bacterium]